MRSDDLRPMAVEAFIARVQAYYGQYPEPVAEAVMFYLKDFSPIYIAALYRTLILRYSRKWGQVPDVAVLAEPEIANEAMSIFESYRMSTPRLEEPAPTDEEREEMAEKIHELVAKLAGAKHF